MYMKEINGKGLNKSSLQKQTGEGILSQAPKIYWCQGMS